MYVCMEHPLRAERDTDLYINVTSYCRCITKREKGEREREMGGETGKRGAVAGGGSWMGETPLCINFLMLNDVFLGKCSL